ncbi:hypothetical protein IH992_19860 [Candidatus Poribacteria bacterium]|nr:hypothetical protein [Candidatus Poribacteria bacterium]
MAGRRQKHFRSGDLNEELGVFLVKGVAAVATVPRPEDVGVDAVATLLRDADNNLLIAENSFYVQFKSSSVRKIKYVDHEVRWLESLKLPFFIGSVRKGDAAIDLYATHKLSQAVLEMNYKEVHLLLDRQDKNEARKDVKYVNIGPPLLQWSAPDLADPKFAPRAYSVLKPYLDAEQRNIDYRGIRYIETIRWETGKPPNCEQAHMIFQSMESEEEIQRILRSMAPYIYAIAVRAMATQDRDAMQLVLSLVNYMRTNNFDPDPHQIYWTVVKSWEQNTANSST